MPQLEDLYREIILDHYRNPRNRGELPVPPARRAEGFNPLCGDEVFVYLDVDDGTVRDVRISGQGCSISQSSASMMSAAVKGRSLDEVRSITGAVKGMLGVGEPVPEVALGELEALQGVVKFPVRIKCATLPWNTLALALADVEDSAVRSDHPVR